MLTKEVHLIQLPFVVDHQQTLNVLQGVNMSGAARLIADARAAFKLLPPETISALLADEQPPSSILLRNLRNFNATSGAPEVETYDHRDCSENQRISDTSTPSVNSASQAYSPFGDASMSTIQSASELLELQKTSVLADTIYEHEDVHQIATTSPASVVNITSSAKIMENEDGSFSKFLKGSTRAVSSLEKSSGGETDPSTECSVLAPTTPCQPTTSVPPPAGLTTNEQCSTVQDTAVQEAQEPLWRKALFPKFARPHIPVKLLLAPTLMMILHLSLMIGSTYIYDDMTKLVLVLSESPTMLLLDISYDMCFPRCVMFMYVPHVA